ncbi:MAG: tyrosine-type recombinase/integrase [Allosphingosinicella sp.]|uniref:tyrosine-type recombinase/integrase n=1 Tax=Allosphingosinicella sp. TaxID=2823234 RepID=UPI0039240E31
MARTVKDHRLGTRAERGRLPQRAEPYWRLLSEGLHLGYYHGKRCGKWVVRFRPPGRDGGYVKETLGETDDLTDANGSTILSYKEAVAKAHAWLEALGMSGGRRPGSFTVGDALDEYLGSFKGKGIVDTKSRIEAIIRPALGHRQVKDLTTGEITEWHEARAKAPARLRTAKGSTKLNVRPTDGPDAIRKRQSTANRDLTVLKAALNKAAGDRKWLDKRVWGDVQPFQKVDVPRRRFLSDDEAAKLIGAAEEAFRPMVEAALLTGGRYGELRHAEVRDYDPESSTLWLAEVKGRDPRPAYLDPAGVELIERHIEGKSAEDLIFTRPDGAQWGKGHQRRRMHEAFASADIPTTTYHDLRRSYGARLARRGVPLTIIAEAMGHADERITRKHYAHLAPSHVADAVRAGIVGITKGDRAK